MIRNEFCPVVSDVFTHLLRNALDHGLESTAERLTAGKPAVGSIFIHTTWQDDGAVIGLRDDGRGLNIKRIRAKAMEAGLLSSDEASDVHKVAECLFLSGVSTAEKVTAISGRGVGMDAVRQFLQQQDGNIRLKLASSAEVNQEFIAFELVVFLPNKMLVHLNTG
jgi:two-component system chemotaxis sensor kinase CheA